MSESTLNFILTLPQKCENQNKKLCKMVSLQAFILKMNQKLKFSITGKKYLNLSKKLGSKPYIFESPFEDI